jgi:aromatic-L-amino-acid/L-tryptophan decarboxylase
MNSQEFRQRAHQLVDWMADYLENIEQYPVKSQVEPQEILSNLPNTPPLEAEPFDLIFQDFREKIMPGITHWQHPSFFAYFPANSSFPAILAEMLTATLGAQCMIWETSPAAAELEEQMMEWLKTMMGIPNEWAGVIQDTASTATLCAILTAREQFSDFKINEQGFDNQQFTVYCSTQTHSSIDKAVKIAGLGKQSLRKIAVDANFAMRPDELEKCIQLDISKGKRPLCVVAAIGTTSSTAIDPLRKIGEICQKYGIFLHVDGAYAGTASILPEKRWILDGLELADSYVFNPHKWMLTNFDCTAYFVKNQEMLIRTFEILPEYLKTKNDTQVNNYRDWGIQLGRRFRALKLWFVIRSFGVAGIQEKIRLHIDLAQNLKQKIEAHPSFELLAPVDFNLVCFRYKPLSINDLEKLNQLNAQLLDQINQTGKAYLTHTKLNDIYTLRLVIGQTQVEARHLEAIWALILEKINFINE